MALFLVSVFLCLNPLLQIQNWFFNDCGIFSINLLQFFLTIDILIQLQDIFVLGQKSIRPYWKNYFENTDVLVSIIVCRILLIIWCRFGILSSMSDEFIGQCNGQKQSSGSVLQKSILRNFTKVRSRPAILLKKRLAQVFSCEFWKIFKSTFFIEHLWRLLLNGVTFNFVFTIYKKTQSLIFQRKGKKKGQKKKRKGKDLQEKNISFLFSIMLNSFNYWVLEIKVSSSQNLWIQSWIQCKGFFFNFPIKSIIKKK